MIGLRSHSCGAGPVWKRPCVLCRQGPRALCAPCCPPGSHTHGPPHLLPFLLLPSLSNPSFSPSREAGSVRVCGVSAFSTPRGHRAKVEASRGVDSVQTLHGTWASLLPSPSLSFLFRKMETMKDLPSAVCKYRTQPSWQLVCRWQVPGAWSFPLGDERWLVCSSRSPPSGLLSSVLSPW